MNSLPQQKTIVKYDKSRRVWQAINGEVKEFAASEGGKQAAMLEALRHDRPKLFTLISEIIEMHGGNISLTDRLIKAAQLLAKGKVYQGAVKSQGSDKVYQVSFSVTYHCDCPDAQDGGAASFYGPICKHGLAQLLAYLLDEKLAELV